MPGTHLPNRLGVAEDASGGEILNNRSAPMMVMEVVGHQTAEMNRARVEAGKKVGEGPESAVALERGTGRLKNPSLQILGHVRKGKAGYNQPRAAESVAGQDVGRILRGSVMKAHAGEAAHQITVKFVVELDPEILDSRRHPFPQHTGEGAGSGPVFHDDVTGFQIHLVNHGLPELA